MSHRSTTERIYIDTSVLGGCYDDEFADDSRRLFQLAVERRLVLVVSQVVADELADAPARVQQVLTSLPLDCLEITPLTPKVIMLRDAYLAAGIVNRKWLEDATHVAAATVAAVNAIVSWNFRHIVRLDRIEGYNRVNVEQGYAPLVIITPLEVARETNSDEDV